MNEISLQERQPIPPLKCIVESQQFNFGVVVLIFLGAFTVGLSTYPEIMSRWKAVVSTVDYIIIGLFTIEIFLRISAEFPKPWRYFQDGWNLFDFTIVVLCLLPFNNDAILVIRLVRLLRVMRIFRALPRLRLLIKGIARSISSVGYVAALLFLHFYIFAILGISLFGSYDHEHFGDLGKAFLTLFQVLTLENWPDVLAPVKAAFPVIGVLFFVIFIVTGTMVVMNLFVGVIVGGMSEAIQDDKKETNDQATDKESLVTILKAIERIEHKLVELEGKHQNSSK